ncbi:mCG1037506, partial [Mus musculus]
LASPDGLKRGSISYASPFLLQALKYVQGWRWRSRKRGLADEQCFLGDLDLISVLHRIPLSLVCFILLCEERCVYTLSVPNPLINEVGIGQ